MTQNSNANGDYAQRLEPFLPALSYSAPFLIEKLRIERIVESQSDAEALFTEVKRFIVIDRSFPEMHFQMYSNRIDEAWHQFILFTLQYTEFCFQYFKRYVHHAPSNAPTSGENQARVAASREDFARIYEAALGIPIPDTWLDNRSVRPSARVINDGVHKLSVQENGHALLRILLEDRPLFSVGALARTAMAFIAQTESFFIRELPNDLTDEEKMALVTMLMDYHVLRIAP